MTDARKRLSVLIAFGTVEGQTGKIARFIEDQVKSVGHGVVLVDTSDRTVEADFDTVDKVILAGSVHERRHPKPFEVFLSGHRDELDTRPSLLVSVSLSAAFPEGLSEAQEYVDELQMRAGFEPDAVACVAGAIRMGKYDYYAVQVLRHVILRGRDFDQTQNEHEFTDWDVLQATVSEFLDA